MERAGLVKRREAVTLTGRGWLAAVSVGLLLLAGVAWVAIRGVVPFLSKSAPIAGAVVVVEGWVPDDTEARIKAELERSGLPYIIITGNPLEKGEPLAEYKDYAHLTKAALLRRGWREDQLIAVAAGEKLRDRTYAAARELRSWIVDHPDRHIRSINIISMGVHSRRTWLLYRRALQGVAEVGVIAAEDLRFDQAHWWRSSEGVRMTLDEAIAYVYARWIFKG